MSVLSYNFVTAEENTTLELGSLEANSGDEISVPININNCATGVATVSIKVTYDSSRLEYTGMEQNIYQGTAIANGNNPGEVLINTMAISNYKGDGALFTLKFKVNDTDEKNVLTELQLDVTELFYLDNAYELINIERSVSGGKVTINQLGDITTESTTQKETETTTKADTSTETTTETITETTTADTTNENVNTVMANKVDGANSIVFVSGVDSLDYSEVGFMFEVNGRIVERSTDTVYSSIENSKYTLNETGGKYMYGFTITDIDATDFGTEIKVTPYFVTIDGEKVLGETYVCSMESLI